MATELEFAKAESIVRDVEQLVRRSRAAGLSVTAYILELAVVEARRDVRGEGERAQPR